jgi:hypothetical protein
MPALLLAAILLAAPPSAEPAPVALTVSGGVSLGFQLGY